MNYWVKVLLKHMKQNGTSCSYDTLVLNPLWKEDFYFKFTTQVGSYLISCKLALKLDTSFDPLSPCGESQVQRQVQRFPPADRQVWLALWVFQVQNCHGDPALWQMCTRTSAGHQTARRPWWITPPSPPAAAQRDPHVYMLRRSAAGARRHLSPSKSSMMNT